jgi:hypothetical protein
VTDHAELGASSSGRWMACPGSVPLSRPYEGRQSIYAAEGHVAHALAEADLTRRPRASVGDVVEADGHKVMITQEMDDAVDAYLDVVRPILDAADDGGFELKVTIKSAPLTANCYGTTDFTALVGRKLHVVDFKYGKGVRVQVAGNSQALFYALATYETLDLGDQIDEIEITIVQPRIDGAEKQTWTIDLIDLLIWRDSQFLPAVQRIIDGDKTLQDGPWCRFCPALAACPLKHELAQEAARTAFPDDIHTDPAALAFEMAHNSRDVSAVEIAQRLSLALRLADWIEALKDEATILIRQGEDVPGWKLVEGRSNRKWGVEPTEVLHELKTRGGFASHALENFYAPPELLSPAQMEKTLKRLKRNPAELMEGLIVRPPGKPALVPVNDPRPAMRIMSVREAFEKSVEELDP